MNTSRIQQLAEHIRSCDDYYSQDITRNIAGHAINLFGDTSADDLFEFHTQIRQDEILALEEKALDLLGIDNDGDPHPLFDVHEGGAHVGYIAMMYYIKNEDVCWDRIHMIAASSCDLV